LDRQDYVILNSTVNVPKAIDVLYPYVLVYRERSYPARKVQGRDGSYTVAADSLVPELLDGIRSLDPAAFKLDEEIACYCSDEEIQKLADEELVEIIYEWQRL
ncbi:hypothetical protein, partial [Parabacteroides merdae]|uniref:hypothetical protein n=1 Tax=Parabacteroides merdae TaxID=46503 RepID=UPI002FE5C9CE